MDTGIAIDQPVKFKLVSLIELITAHLVKSYWYLDM